MNLVIFKKLHKKFLNIIYMADTISYYSNKIHTNPEFYDAEKKRVVKYLVNRHNTDDEYKTKKKGILQIENARII